MHFDTAVDVSHSDEQVLRSLLSGSQPLAESRRDALDDRVFTIRSADTCGRRSRASVLINRMYATRGYRTTSLSNEPLPTRVTLVASEDDVTVGTITVGFDSSAGLHVDDLFPQEVASLRDVGQRLCEFTRLAMDSVVRSKRALASLFHVAHIHAHRLAGADSVLIEVNPRHVRYYERMLGFKALGEERWNRRVDAPAILMCLDLSHAQEQIERFGGRPECSEVERSLYPYFFSTTDEAGIAGRLRQSQPLLRLQTLPTRGPRRAHEASLVSH